MKDILAVVRQNLGSIRKSPKLADENMFGEGNIPNFAHNLERGRQGRNGLSIIYGIVRAPFSLLSCLSQPHINAADGVWVSGELARESEINHLMVSESMRYAIFDVMNKLQARFLSLLIVFLSNILHKGKV